MWSQRTVRLVRLACAEDLGRRGDITPTRPGGATRVAARLVPRADGVICGLALAPLICAVFGRRLNAALRFRPAKHAGRTCTDGQPVAPGQTVATLSGPRAAVLAVERTLLNFLGRLSGVATLTARFVAMARSENPDVKVLDTRKTIPGWRELDKYAVRCGGGQNHRFGLYDAVLIKDNHLAGVPTRRLAQTLTEMLAGVGRRRPAFVEVEVDSLAQLAAVCKVPGVNVILLDNFAPTDLREAVAYRDRQGLRGRVALEASGRVTLENIAAIAASGVERISVGALTHSAASLDLGLDF